MSKDTTASSPQADPSPRRVGPRGAALPRDRAPLVDGTGPDGNPELHSTDPERPLAYPVRDGIPVLLEGDARAL
ncbi:hypothetical protein NKG05_21175 [Oerskovia sp. M15]